MIEANLSRKAINQYTERIKRMYRWGVENELIPAATYQALALVAGLKNGRSRARETAPVQPVPDHDVDATLNELSTVVRAMVELPLGMGCLRPEVPPSSGWRRGACNGTRGTAREASALTV